MGGEGFRLIRMMIGVEAREAEGDGDGEACVEEEVDDEVFNLIFIFRGVDTTDVDCSGEDFGEEVAE